MTVHQSKNKTKKTFFIASAIIILVGVAAFVLAYGISDGWGAVASWFASKYAILLYMFLGVYGLLVLLVFAYERIKRL